MKRSLLAAVVMLVMLVACAPSGVRQAEYDQVASELASAKQQAADLQFKLTAAEQRAASEQSELDQLHQEREQAAKAAAWWQDFKANYGHFDTKPVSTFYAEDCWYSDPDVTLSGIENIRQMAEELAAGGDRIEVKSLYGGADWGALEAIWYTTRAGRLRTVPFASIFVLKDGKISQEHCYWDDMLLR